MKTYSIGRDVNCDIVINDATDVISRRHALLNITPSGKMTIIDQSTNGTYVNGIRISPNVPVPVSRKDTVSLAHVCKLDWGMVPRSNAAMRYAIFGFIGLLVIIGAVFGIKALTNNHSEEGPSSEVVVDSVAIKNAEKAKQDSLKQDSIQKATKEQGEKKKKEATTQQQKKTDPTKKDPKGNVKDKKEKDKAQAEKEKEKERVNKRPV